VDELVNQVVQRTGISESQARQAVQVVLGFVKDRLPGPMASQVDNLLGSQGRSGGPDLGNMGNSLGDMFGDNS
jgi:uncharacterized protein (DUF2267 family)